jgi:hypothetical protein
MPLVLLPALVVLAASRQSRSASFRDIGAAPAAS